MIEMPLKDITNRSVNVNHPGGSSPATPSRLPTMERSTVGRGRSDSPRFMTPTFSSKQATTSKHFIFEKQESPDAMPLRRQAGPSAGSANVKAGRASPALATPRVSHLAFPDKLAIRPTGSDQNSPPSFPERSSSGEKPLPSTPATMLSRQRSQAPLNDTAYAAKEHQLSASPTEQLGWPFQTSKRAFHVPRMATPPRTASNPIASTAKDVTGPSPFTDRYPKLGACERAKTAPAGVGDRSAVSTALTPSPNSIGNIRVSSSRESKAAALSPTKSPLMNDENKTSMSAAAAALEKSASQDLHQDFPTRASSLRARLSTGSLVVNGAGQVVGFTDFTSATHQTEATNGGEASIFNDGPPAKKSADKAALPKHVSTHHSEFALALEAKSKDIKAPIPVPPRYRPYIANLNALDNESQQALTINQVNSATDLNGSAAVAASGNTSPGRFDGLDTQLSPKVNDSSDGMTALPSYPDTHHIANDDFILDEDTVGSESAHSMFDGALAVDAAGESFPIVKRLSSKPQHLGPTLRIASSAERILRGGEDKSVEAVDKTSKRANSRLSILSLQSLTELVSSDTASKGASQIPSSPNDSIQSRDCAKSYNDGIVSNQKASSPVKTEAQSKASSSAVPESIGEKGARRPTKERADSGTFSVKSTKANHSPIEQPVADSASCVTVIPVGATRSLATDQPTSPPSTNSTSPTANIRSVIDASTPHVASSGSAARRPVSGKASPITVRKPSPPLKANSPSPGRLEALAQPKRIASRETRTVSASKSQAFLHSVAPQASKRDSIARDSIKSQKSLNLGLSKGKAAFRTLFQRKPLPPMHLDSQQVNDGPPAEYTLKKKRSLLGPKAQSTVRARPATASPVAAPTKIVPLLDSSEVSSTAQLAIKVLDAARSEQDMAKKQSLMDMGRILVDVVTRATEAQKAVEEARNAVRKAEVASLGCNHAVAGVGKIVAAMHQQLI